MRSRADVQRIMATTRLSEDELYEQEMEKLKKLELILSRAETAEALYSLDEGKSLKAAVERLEDAGMARRFEKSDENDENMNDDDADPLSLQQALKHRKAPTGAMAPIGNKVIVLGKNKTKVGFGGVKKDASKSWNNAAANVEKTQRQLASEDFLDNHRTVNNGNLVHRLRQKVQRRFRLPL